MDRKRSRRGSSADDQSGEQGKRESGQPGGGQGRRDEVGPTGVYPPGADNVPPDAEIRMAGSWGGGDYNESGGSELVYRDGQLLGGLTAGPDGEPTIDIHGGDRAPDTQGEAKGGGDYDESGAVDAVDRDALLLRGLPPGDEGQSETRGETARDERAQS